MKRGGNRVKQQIASPKVGGWVRSQTYSHENLLIVRKYSNVSEWVSIEPTETQPLKVLLLVKRTKLTRHTLRFVAALYINDLSKIQFSCVRQPFSFMQWLQMVVQWSYVMNQEWAPTLEKLQQLATTHPNWVNPLDVPGYALMDELKAADDEGEQ